MALSEAQKFDVVRLLGYPGKTLIESSTHYNTTIAGRLTNLGSEIERDVGRLLSRVVGLDEKLDKALGRASALKVGDIELNPHEMELLRGERAKVIRELSSLLDIVIFSSASGVNFGVLC